MLLGRAEGLTEEKIAHLADDPLPPGLYEPWEAAIVRYAQHSARNDTITNEIYEDLERHFPVEKMVQICFVVGLAGMTNRFHKTFLTTVDPSTQEEITASCPMPVPQPPSQATLAGDGGTS